MKIKNRILEMSRGELIDMIKNHNPDRHDKLKDQILDMIDRFNI
jgi:hypothetical protein